MPDSDKGSELVTTKLTPGDDIALLDKGLVGRYVQMVTALPAEQEGGMENILEQILSATTWEELDSPWDVSTMDDVLGRKFMLQRAYRRPSDFRSGLGVFLVLHLVDIDTGEMTVKTTSSVSILGQVARAYMLQVLPCVVEFIVAERPTDKGFHPHHLKFHASAAGEATTSAEQVAG